MDVSVIGLGLVGQALAGRLLAAGWQVRGYDLAPEARAAARALGVDVCASAQDAAAATRTVVLSLPDAAARRALLWGQQALAGQCAPGSLLLDTTTCAPQETITDHQRLLEQDVTLVDVSIVGSSEQVARGEVQLLVGGEARAVPAELLRAWSGQVFYLGGVGQGNRLKLLVNLVLGLNRLVLAEGLALAERAGFDAAQVLHVLKQGAAYSRIMDTKGEKMLERAYTPVARLAQHAKDVDLILTLARECGAHTPVSELHAELLAQALALGLGASDNAAVIELFRARGAGGG